MISSRAKRQISQHHKPCNECPFRRKSLPGYLGNYTLEEFQYSAMSDMRMPCHMKVDYESPDWKEQFDTAPQCAGRAIHWSNQCKQPRTKGLLLQLPKNIELVFQWPNEFTKHHESFQRRKPEGL